jgi:hypothetical protein
VRRTRFDPLHEAAGEQRLWDALPGWLEALAHGDVLTLELPAAGTAVDVELRRADFEAAVQGHYDGVLQVLRRLRPAGGPLHLRVSHRWTRLPGFVERLSELRDCDVVALPRGAAALGALAFEQVLRRDAASLALVQRLPVALTQRPVAVAPVRVARSDRPTHVVHGGRAWPLGARPLPVGTAVPAPPQGVPVVAGPGVSRVHCRLWTDAEGAWLEDQSTYGTLVNGERIGGRTALRAGDRLRLGHPGVELELVRVVDADGAA